MLRQIFGFALTAGLLASTAHSQEAPQTPARGPANEAGIVATRLGKLELDHGLPTVATRQKLYDELDFQRAVQGVIWAEPAVNNWLFQRGMAKVGVPNLGAMVYNGRMHPGQETLTPNQSVVYLYDSVNLAETGPVVHITPPGPINAGFFDMWMRPVYDFGTVGPNKGKGDRILIVPPGYTGALPESYQVARARTNQIFSITRLSVKEGMTEAQATALFKKVQTYRLADAAAAPVKGLVLMGNPASGGKEFRMNRPAGLDYWRMVHDIIDKETIEDRDRVMLDSLAAVGVERGKPFAPDARMAKILVDAEQTGKLMMINEAFSPRAVPDGVVKELYAGTHWENIALLPSMTQEGPKFSFVTSRMVGFYQANGAQFAWDPRDYPAGFGQKYAAAYQDKSGNWLKGENSYRLRVPAKVPVADFWAVTIYDTDTRALIETPQHRAEINPNVNKLKANADGSIDLFFSPKAPAGMESNWVRTNPERAWFTYFRWYGPTAPYYDKSWSLPDFEKLP